jgi:serine/threonine protein phosphatase PrpC
MLSEEDIVNVLIRHPAHPARALTEAAVDAGGHDNVTVILIGRVSREG